MIFVKNNIQSRQKQSRSGPAWEAVNNSRMKCAATFWTFLFLAVRRCSHCTSASNWESKAWKFSHTEHITYVCTLKYVPCQILLQQFSLGTRPHKSGTDNYVSLSAENGPAGHDLTSSSAYAIDPPMHVVINGLRALRQIMWQCLTCSDTRCRSLLNCV